MLAVIGGGPGASGRVRGEATCRGGECAARRGGGGRECTCNAMVVRRLSLMKFHATCAKSFTGTPTSAKSFAMLFT